MKSEIDNLPTPEHLDNLLRYNAFFPDDQAMYVASEVYQPLYSAIKTLYERSKEKSDSKSGISLDVLRDKLELAFMHGQIDCGVDPSYSSARNYADGVLANISKQEKL